MFIREPELSPDLVWLLQSQLVEDDILAPLLVKETYMQLLPFWEALLGNSQDVHQAIQETLSSALIKAHTYREAQSIRSWLIGLAIELYRKDRLKTKRGNKTTLNKDLQLGQLSSSSRLAVVLRFRLDFTPDEVAGFLRESPSSTQIRLWDARQLLLRQIGNGNVSGGYQAEEDLLTQAFQRAYPATTLSETDLENLSQEVIEGAQRKRHRLKRAAYWKEISLISVVILSVFVWMGRAHLDTPEATAAPSVGIALAGSVPRRARPTRQPTGTPYAWAGNYSRMSPPWTPTSIPEDAFYTVKEGDTLWEIAINLGASTEELRSLNRLPEQSILVAGQRLLKPGSLRLDAPTPSSPPFQVGPSAIPLRRARSMEEYLQRRKSLPIRSVWLDIQVSYRGPLGYLGEAQTLRMQVWSSVDKLLMLAGNDFTSPNTAFKVRHEEQAEIYLADLNIGNPWFEYSPFSEEIGSYLQTISRLLNVKPDHWRDQPVNTVFVGSGNVGDRPAYIFNQLDQQRLLRTIWKDQVSNLPLRILVYDPHNPQRIVTETLVTGLEINPDIPEALFNPQIPWMGGYAKNSRGDPLAPGENLSPWKDMPVLPNTLPYTPSVLELDPTISSLQFQFKQIPPLFSNPEIETLYEVEIFAFGEHLGSSLMPNPFFTLCDRSADGRRLAYMQASLNSLDVFSRYSLPGFRIRWINLSNPRRVHTSASTLRPFMFKFSPDGEQLAVYGEDLSYKRGIYLVDLQQDELRLLQPAKLAHSLAWKPDGKQLAYISRSEGSPSDASLLVLDVGSGEVMSQQSFPSTIDAPGQNDRTWPPMQWDVPFPVGMGDLGACAAPPAG